VSDVLSQEDRDAYARAAFAKIEAVLDRRCPEKKVAFWAAVDRHYRLDVPLAGRPRTVPRSNLEVRPPGAQD